MENHIHNVHDHNNVNNHNVSHHKMNAIKAIKSGWKHIMKSPWTYIGFTFLFIIVSAMIGATPVVKYFIDFISILLSMVVLKFLLHKYESKKVEINFTFMEYVHFFVAQFILGIGFLLLFIAVALPTFYPIYTMTVTDKQVFWGDVKTLMKEGDKRGVTNVEGALATLETNDVYENINLSQYVDITGDETAVFSLLTLFLIGLCAIIYLAFRVSMTQWFLIDKKFGPIEAIKHSWHATRNNMTQLSILALLSTLIMFAGALVLFVGLLFAMPLVYMIALDAYKQMIGESK